MEGLKVFSNFVLLFHVALATFDCPSLFNFYPDEHDCSKFYRCIWGKGHSFKCPSGTYWHHDLLTCDHIKNVECDKEPLSHTTFDPEEGKYKTEYFESPDFSVDHMDESYYDDDEEHEWEDEGSHEEEHSSSAGSSDHDWEEHEEESHHSEDYSEHHDEHEEDHGHEDHGHEEEHDEEEHGHEEDHGHEEEHEEEEHHHEEDHGHEEEHEEEEHHHEEDHGHEEEHEEEEHHHEEEHHTHEEHHTEEHDTDDDHHHEESAEEEHHDHHDHEPQVDHSDLQEKESEDFHDEDYVSYVIPNYYPEYISIVEHESKQTPSGTKETAPKPTAFIQTPKIQLVPHERPAKDTPSPQPVQVVAVAQPVQPVIPPPIVVAKPTNEEEKEEIIDFIIDKLEQLPRYGGHFYNPNLVITDGTRDLVEVGLSDDTIEKLETIIEPYRTRKRARDWLLRKKWLQSRKTKPGTQHYRNPSADKGEADQWATAEEKDRKKPHFEAYRRKTRALHNPWETTDLFRAGYGPNKIYHKK